MPKSERERELLKVFSERLKLLREEKGMTLIVLSDSAKIGLSTLSQYENMVRSPKFPQIVKLCLFFDVTSDYLMGLSDERK